MLLCVYAQTALAFLLLQVERSNTQSFPCCEGEIRLMNGNGRSDSHEGRVEICYTGQWKTICDDHWETSDAQVVCTQLGYVSEGAEALCHDDSTFGQGASSLSILERVNCQGTEPLLINCTLIDYNDRFDYCFHSDDAGVRCVATTNNCTEGEIRLANNSAENEGRVEICVKGFWGTMCPNNASTLNTNVICKQLGFSEYGAEFISLTGRPLPVHIHDIACSGHEVKLIDCPHRKGIFNCPSCNSYGIHCSYDTAPAPTGLDIVIDEQNYATVTWEPPRLAKRHGKLFSYSITCSTAHHGSPLIAATLNTTKEMWLKPYETYQCCVSAVNQMGPGFPSCKLFATNEGAPTAPPTNVSRLMLNCSSVLIFWNAPPIEHQNGIVRGYHVELSGDNTSLRYTTEAPFLVVDHLMPNTDYNSSVAAYTTMRGLFSEPITISLHHQTNQIITTTMEGNKTTSRSPAHTKSQQPSTTSTSMLAIRNTSDLAESVRSTLETSTLAMYILAITTGTLVVVLVAIVVVFGAAYFHRSYTASSENGNDEIYDTVDEPKQGSNRNPKLSNSLSERKQSLNLIITEKSIGPEISDNAIKRLGSIQSRPNNPNTTENSNYQPLIPPRKLNQENKYQCLSPTQERIQLGQYENDSAGVFINSDVGREKKDTYQSLIQEEQMGSDSSDYQCLTGFTHQPSIPESGCQEA